MKFPKLESHNSDILAILTDEELDFQYKKAVKERDQVIKMHADPLRWEEEICYLQREKQIREVRKETHEIWREEYRRNFEYADEFFN